MYEDIEMLEAAHSPSDADKSRAEALRARASKLYSENYEKLLQLQGLAMTFDLEILDVIYCIK